MITFHRYHQTDREFCNVCKAPAPAGYLDDVPGQPDAYLCVACAGKAIRAYVESRAVLAAEASDPGNRLTPEEIADIKAEATGCEPCPGGNHYRIAGGECGRVGCPSKASAREAAIRRCIARACARGSCNKGGRSHDRLTREKADEVLASNHDPLFTWDVAFLDAAMAEPALADEPAVRARRK